MGLYEAISISSAPGPQGRPGTPPGHGIPPLGCPGPAGMRGARGVGPTVRNSRAPEVLGAEFAVGPLLFAAARGSPARCGSADVTSSWFACIRTDRDRDPVSPEEILKKYTPSLMVYP